MANIDVKYEDLKNAADSISFNCGVIENHLEEIWRGIDEIRTSNFWGGEIFNKFIGEVNSLQSEFKKQSKFVCTECPNMLQMAVNSYRTAEGKTGIVVASHTPGTFPTIPLTDATQLKWVEK